MTSPNKFAIDLATKGGAVSVPREALNFKVGEFAISDANGENAKSAPVTLKARSGESIDHWYWGRVVHDLAGMKMEKARVAIDWDHDSNHLIGYLNKFDITSGDLVASGALVPYGDDDKATEIIYKASQGVPYEASISFPGGDQAIEVLAENQVATVNGRTFEGPGVIFREWTLRGVAICAMGADHRTSAEFSDDERTFSVRVVQPEHFSEEAKENSMTAEIVKPIVDAPKTPDLAEGAAAPVAPVEGKTAEELAEEAKKLAAPVDGKTPEELRAEEGKKFMEAFGDKGAMMFAMGKTFEVARDEFTAELKAENAAIKAKNEELASKLQSISGLGEVPVTSSANMPEPAAETFAEKFAAYQKETGCTLTEAMSATAKQYPALYQESKQGRK